jgi:hypothetical protein
MLRLYNREERFVFDVCEVLGEQIDYAVTNLSKFPGIHIVSLNVSQTGTRINELP